jgi:hypothetical protein
MHDLERAKRGEIHGFHSGFPCSSFSMVMFKPGGPPPVRDRSHPLGFPGNNKAQRLEALKGNLGALRSVVMCRATVWGAKQQGWDATAKLENPDDPAMEPFPSAWLLRQVQDWGNASSVTRAVYNLCAYGPPHWKRTIEGVLSGIEKLTKTCPCKDPHVPLVGPEKTRQSAAYPPALMEAYAEFWPKTCWRNTRDWNRRVRMSPQSPIQRSLKMSFTIQ